ncbi:hypothetical protein NDU88_006602 [Pleurodeles waltl]|uniref:Uncharacterized protein n=1 Tax=Pleurodeles waltl TaxID=8319 RepID=A0AAV7QM91_PLEWA|nr:hypothetical protein NDU88_006602 [Pleurodeles waltl]
MWPGVARNAANTTTPPPLLQRTSHHVTSCHGPLIRSSNAPPLGVGIPRLSATVGRHLCPPGRVIPPYGRALRAKAPAWRSPREYSLSLVVYFKDIYNLLVTAGLLCLRDVCASESSYPPYMCQCLR